MYQAYTEYKYDPVYKYKSCIITGEIDLLLKKYLDLVTI